MTKKTKNQTPSVEWGGGPEELRSSLTDQTQPLMATDVDAVDAFDEHCRSSIVGSFGIADIWVAFRNIRNTRDRDLQYTGAFVDFYRDVQETTIKNPEYKGLFEASLDFPVPFGFRDGVSMDERTEAVFVDSSGNAVDFNDPNACLSDSKYRWCDTHSVTGGFTLTPGSLNQWVDPTKKLTTVPKFENAVMLSVEFSYPKFVVSDTKSVYENFKLKEVTVHNEIPGGFHTKATCILELDVDATEWVKTFARLGSGIHDMQAFLDEERSKLGATAAESRQKGKATLAQMMSAPPKTDIRCMMAETPTE